MRSLLSPGQKGSTADGKVVTERTRKLRSHYTLLSRSLKQRVEMRINRVPKKMWKMTMGELLEQMEGGTAKGFVKEVRNLRLVTPPLRP